MAVLLASLGSSTGHGRNQGRYRGFPTIYWDLLGFTMVSWDFYYDFLGFAGESRCISIYGCVLGFPEKKAISTWISFRCDHDFGPWIQTQISYQVIKLYIVCTSHCIPIQIYLLNELFVYSHDFWFLNMSPIPNTPTVSTTPCMVYLPTFT